MKTIVHVFFNHPLDVSGRYQILVEQLLREVGREDLAKKSKPPYVLYHLQFIDGSKILNHLRTRLNDLKDEQFIFSERVERIYSNSELHESPLLLLIARTTPKGLGSPTYGTEYDLTLSCKSCGSGSLLIPPLVLDMNVLPKRSKIFSTMDGELVFSKELKAIIIQNDLSGISYGEVEDINGNQLDWSVCMVNNELPRWNNRTKGVTISELCKACQRSGFGHDLASPLELHYDANSINISELPDFSITYESFGIGIIREPFSDSKLPSPGVIVKPTVLEFFEAQAIKGFEFIPVRIDERVE